MTRSTRMTMRATGRVTSRGLVRIPEAFRPEDSMQTTQRQYQLHANGDAPRGYAWMNSKQLFGKAVIRA